jgi:magnesium transporter
VCVVGEDGTFRSLVEAGKLLTAPDDARVDALGDATAVPVAPDADQEHVARLAVRQALPAVPVADSKGRFLGVVPTRALLEILHWEHIEDLHRLAGIQRIGVGARRALSDPPRRRAVHRLPWLLVGLAGSAGAALAVSRFDALIASHVSLAFFLPAIVYLADAIGTQTETIVVRALSFGSASLPRFLGGEMATGAWIGALLSFLAGPAAWAATGDPRVGLTVGLSILVAGALATGIAVLLPWLLWRRGRDPALGSGPLATVVQDVLSVLAYFSIAHLLMAD